MTDRNKGVKIMPGETKRFGRRTITNNGPSPVYIVDGSFAVTESGKSTITVVEE